MMSQGPQPTLLMSLWSKVVSVLSDALLFALDVFPGSCMLFRDLSLVVLLFAGERRENVH